MGFHPLMAVSIGTAGLYSINTCAVVDRQQDFKEKCCLTLQGTHSSTLKVEAPGSSKMLVSIHLPPRRHVSEDPFFVLSTIRMLNIMRVFLTKCH